MKHPIGTKVQVQKADQYDDTVSEKFLGKKGKVVGYIENFDDDESPLHVVKFKKFLWSEKAEFWFDELFKID